MTMRSLLQAARTVLDARGVLAVTVGGLLAVSVACDDDGPMGTDDDVASVQFSTESQTVEMGSTAQLSFEIRDGAGNLIDPADVTIDFSSNATSVATVSGTGLVMPVAPGTAVITIEVGSFTDTITITVIAEISSISVALDVTDLVSDETATLDVTVLDAEGDPVVDPALTFTSSDEAVATVDEDGVVTAVAEGMATITVAGGGESDTIVVTVFEAMSGGLSLTGNFFTATLGDAITINDLVIVRDGGGVVIPDAELEFETTDALVVTVSPAGLLTALASGTALVTVTSPDATGSATFRLNVVDADILDVLELDPAEATVGVGLTVTLTASATTTGGDPIEGLLVVYSSSDETVATVDPLTGEVTGVAAGMATITGTIGGLMAESEITVE